MTDEKLKRANDLNYIIRDINSLYNRFERFKEGEGKGDCISFPYNIMNEENLRRGLFDAGINYLKEQLEKYKKEFEEL